MDCRCPLRLLIQTEMECTTSVLEHGGRLQQIGKVQQGVDVEALL